MLPGPLSQAIRVAVECDAELIVGGRETGNEIAKVRRLRRIRMMIRKAAVDLAEELDHTASQPPEQRGGIRAGDAVPGIHRLRFTSPHPADVTPALVRAMAEVPAVGCQVFWGAGDELGQALTALQMDIKVAGITPQIMREALAQAQRGRLHILDKMEEALPGHREAVSAFAPRFYTLQIPVDKIRDLIGPGGKMIRSIIEQTGVKIDVEDSGKIKDPLLLIPIQMVRELAITASLGVAFKIVTNLVMLEYGHPMHAFDLDLVRGSKIIVRRAAESEAGPP